MAKKSAKNHIVSSQRGKHISTEKHPTKFILYNLAGEAKSYYLVDKITKIVATEPPECGYTYQVSLSQKTKTICGTADILQNLELNPEPEEIIYKYKPITKEVYEQLDVPVAQNHESVYAFARANLADGNFNIAKYAIFSTFDATLTAKHSKALTEEQITDFAQDMEIALFYPKVLREHKILQQVEVNNRISLLELLKVLEAHRNNIIVNLKHLQANYQRTGVKRVLGFRDENGNLIKPWLTTQYLDNGEYVGMGTFELNHNTANINMLITRKVRLIKTEDQTPIFEVAGLLVNDLNSFNNYTIVSEGEVNVKSLQVKISSKKTFDLLREKSVLENKEYDFRREYTIRLDHLPLVPIEQHYSSIEGLFDQLAEAKVLASIISALLKKESDVFLPEQLEELRKHYISKRLNLNFPTTNEYININQALAQRHLDSRISYKIDIGSKDILNLGKLHSANKFLDRMYEVDHTATEEIISKPSFDMIFHENIACKHKQLSSRIKITPVDEFMKPIFDDFLGLDNNGIVARILTKIGAENLAQILQEQHDGKSVNKDEMIEALFSTNAKLEEFTSEIYREKISPLVFYIGATGLLPEEMNVKAMTAEELSTKYPNLQFSKDEQEGTFFLVGDSIISVYATREYYSRQVNVAIEK
jgi:hypothetical protein